MRGEGKIKKEDIPTIIKTPFLGESALLQIPYWSDAMRTPLDNDPTVVGCGMHGAVPVGLV